MTLSQFISGFRFADDISRENAKAAFMGAKGLRGFVPATVVTGPMRSGKTTFVRQLLAARNFEPLPRLMPFDERALWKLLAGEGSYLWFDQSRIETCSIELAMFIVYKPAPVFLTANEAILSADLAARSRFIELEELPC